MERPGAVKWAALIDPATGRVSDQTFEAVASVASLTDKQKDCLETALSKPRYRLPPDGRKATPERVSLVLEF